MSEEAEKLAEKLLEIERLKERLQEKEAGLTQQDRDIRHACEQSLSTFIKYAWKYMDPSEYVHGWHIDAVCFPYNTKITTSAGERLIGEIVETKWRGDVLSYNHSKNKLEFMPILNFMQSPKQKLLKIKSGCDILEATANHPIFIKGAGYVRADQVKTGDKIYKLRPLQKTDRSKEKNFKVLLSEMFHVFQVWDIFKTKYASLRDMRKTIRLFSSKKNDKILQHEMFRSEQKKTREIYLPDLQSSESVGGEGMQEMRVCISNKNEKHPLSRMWESCKNFSSAMEILFEKIRSFLQSQMFWEVLLWRKKRGIYSRRINNNLSCGIHKNEKEDLRKRQKSLFPVPKSRQIGLPSHRQKREQQSRMESCFPVSFVSQQAKLATFGNWELIECAVEEIEECIRICDSVYNIEVKNNNNYFANNVLVHNCEHLEAQARGEIRHLLINQPPRTAKSLIVSVARCPWVWAQPKYAPLMGADRSFLSASYAQTLSFRDSMKARRLISSAWYQKLWGNRFQLSEDMNTKGRFTNNRGGHRIATSVGGQLTGDGANYIEIDDAHNSIEIESDLVRQGVLDWWDSAMSTRHNSPKTDVFTVVMQRLHADDLAGHILDKMDNSWTHLMIPMEYDPDRHCSTSIGFSDPRTEEGELLWPERLGRKEVEALKTSLGPFGSAGQLQQAPMPKGGGVIKDEWWIPWIAPPSNEFPPMEYIIAVADTAYTESQENDYSACVVMGVYRDVYDLPKIMIMHAWQERLGLNALVNKLAKSAKLYKVDRLVIENKASGISVAQEIRRLFANEIFGILMSDPKGDKIARLMSVEPLFAEGIIHVPYIKDGKENAIPRDWVDMLIKQVTQFPKSAHDDLVDCISAGIKHLRDNGLIVRREERDIDLERQMTHTGILKPLYDV